MQTIEWDGSGAKEKRDPHKAADKADYTISFV